MTWTTAERRPSWRIAACLLATTLLVGGGCARGPTGGGARAPTEPRTVRQDAAAPSPPPSLATDPCAVRLEDLGGALLLHYAMNRRLPETLDELTTVPGADASGASPFTCPVSDQRYVYVPGGGLRSPGKARQLVAYDPTPAHGGLRWGLFVSPPSGAEPLATWVTPMSEELFRSYGGAAR